MMENRLILAKSYLNAEGFLWCTLDDNKGSQFELLGICIFGENCIMPRSIWQHSPQSKGYIGSFSLSHNYIFCFKASDNARLGLLERTEEHNVNYSNPDNDPRGPWRSGDVRNALYRPNLIYDIPTSSGKIIKPPPKGWRWSWETMQKKIASGEVIFVDDETRIVRKIYLKDQLGRVPETLWLYKDVGSTRSANKELKDFFGEAAYPTPKPTQLIQRTIHLSGKQKQYVLDYFAGSGTTAHAVINLNREDGGRRKYILVEVADYFDTVLLTRIKKVVFSCNWKDGKPKLDKDGGLNGVSHFFKYIRLESYEDAINKLFIF